MNNSYYINTGQILIYTANNTLYSTDNRDNLKLTNRFDDLTPENLFLITWAPTQQKIPIKEKRDFPLSISELYQKFYKPDQQYLNFVDFFQTPSNTTKSDRQGILVTENNINYKPGQKALYP